MYGSFVADPYGTLAGTLPARANGNIYSEEPFGEESPSINRYDREKNNDALHDISNDMWFGSSDDSDSLVVCLV